MDPETMVAAWAAGPDRARTATATMPIRDFLQNMIVLLAVGLRVRRTDIGPSRSTHAILGPTPRTARGERRSAAKIVI
jgi:hypothetical protein